MDNKFSVLMTVYKMEKPEYLNQSLSSIEEQTLLPQEIVLVEDGPLTDELERVIEIHKRQFKNKFKIIKSNVNRGRGLASRLGLKYISTDWVARVDSDDICYKNRFKLQLEALEKNHNIKMIGGQITEFQDMPQNITGKREVPLSFKEIEKFARYRSPINNPTLMFNKKALDLIGGYPMLNVLEDYDLCIRFLVNNLEIINLPYNLVNMRVNKQMYKRRGGVKYLCQYILMKWKWYKMGIGNIKSLVLSDVLMTGNIILPVNIRRLVYSLFLRKRQK
ncbi:glycosyltransferase [Limosilactobacillus rudii]|nr:glycosyltransferase [Limosilactobacillus rudii]MCD7133704.1 glycosyltransferase [Limosilactobacillus rudii]